jgi:iron-sulfur cluster assembly protein
LPPPITITDNAIVRIKELMDGKDHIGIRLGVRSRGCNGLSYTINYADKMEKMEEQVIKDGIHVIVDPKALFYIVGTVMDYEETPVASEFTFSNPNSKGECGCGESFTV